MKINSSILVVFILFMGCKSVTYKSQDFAVAVENGSLDDGNAG